MIRYGRPWMHSIYDWGTRSCADEQTWNSAKKRRGHDYMGIRDLLEGYVPRPPLKLPIKSTQPFERSPHSTMLIIISNASDGPVDWGISGRVPHASVHRS